MIKEINIYGIMYYNKAGKRHRKNGPAIKWLDKDKDWYLNGELHRIDGPAAEWADGDKEWWLKGYCLFDYEFNNWAERIKALYYDKKD